MSIRSRWTTALLRLVSITALLVVAFVAMPSGASAATTASATAAPRHVGWVYLELNYCAPNRACAELFRVSTTAWRWTGTGGWAQSTVAGGWVYVSPYSGQWRWVWTQQSGWVVVQGGRFELRTW